MDDFNSYLGHVGTRAAFSNRIRIFAIRQAQILFVKQLLEIYFSFFHVGGGKHRSGEIILEIPCEKKRIT
jgi:hypothetical protein